MPLIECKTGPTTQSVGGIEYRFERDVHGRCVAHVANEAHMNMFLAVDAHYARVDENPKPQPTAPARNQRPKKPAAGLTPPPDPVEGAAGGEGAGGEGEGEGEGEGGEGDEDPPGDDITRIKGVGRSLQSRLAESGYTRLSQIAALSDSDAQALDAILALHGRIIREKWVEQAKALLAGE